MPHNWVSVGFSKCTSSIWFRPAPATSFFVAVQTLTDRKVRELVWWVGSGIGIAEVQFYWNEGRFDERAMKGAWELRNNKMSGGSLGIRSGSYGSLEKQQQQLQNNGVSLIQSARKPTKTLKEKDRFFLWIFKFAGRKKVGMLCLFTISAAVFIWVLYVGKGSSISHTFSLLFNISKLFSFNN